MISRKAAREIYACDMESELRWMAARDSVRADHVIAKLRRDIKRGLHDDQVARIVAVVDQIQAETATHMEMMAAYRETFGA